MKVNKTRLAIAGTVIWAAIAVLFGGVIAPANAATRQPSCGSQLKVIREVSRQAGITIGSTQTSPHNQGTPRSWAKELKAAGLDALARTAAGIHDARSDHDFVVAMTATADAMLTTSACVVPNLRYTGFPMWFGWEAGHAYHGYPCMLVWGGTGRTSARVCADGKAFTS